MRLLILSVFCVQLMRVVESEAQSVSSYVDIIKKVILLIGDKNLSTCKIAGRVLVAIGNDMRHLLICRYMLLTVSLTDNKFLLPARRYASAVFAPVTCLSVCLSGRLSHAGIVPSRAKAGS